MDLERIAGARFDALILGGGITGVATAHRLARLGWSPLLIEPRDLAWGTSSRSSRLIHGGLRYLAHGELRLVRRALAERRALARIAPHLVRPTPMLLPLGRGEPLRWRTFAPAGVVAYDLLAGRRGWPRGRTIGRDEAETLVPGLRLGDERRVRVFYDGVTDDRRLTLVTAMAAREAGAQVVGRCELLGLEATEHGARARLRDLVSGQTLDVVVRSVVNATGPWVDRVRQRYGATRRGRLVRPSRGSHLAIPWRIDAAMLVPHPRDGRVGFFVPTATGMIVGTTDVADEGDPDAVRPSPDEIAYLEELADDGIPGMAGRERTAWAGLRPLAESPGPTNALSRAARYVMESVEGIPFLSIVGGKLTLHRVMARDAVRRLRPHLGTPPRPARPDTAHLPGGDLATLAGLEARLRATGLDPTQARWMVSRYGSQAEAVLGDEPPAPLGRGSIPLACEVGWAVREEGARTLSDVLLRWRLPELALDAEDETRIARAALTLLAHRLGLGSARAERERARWERERRAVWGGTGDRAAATR
ncbi:MAG: glycerol-3-phosphate dehydrogenase [Acidobacteriota bacterium]